jgi:hypothetical protein
MFVNARSTIQDPADLETGQMRQEEYDCEAGEVASAWQRPSNCCPRTGLLADDTCFEEHDDFVGWDATWHSCF